jgi:uncharacterized protein YbjT (DUF2867 family)
MSTIAVIGASGYVGGNIAKEALSRGYEVIAVTRSTPPDAHEGLTWRQGDLADEGLLRELASQASTIILAVHGEQAHQSTFSASATMSRGPEGQSK